MSECVCVNVLLPSVLTGTNETVCDRHYIIT